MKEPANVTGSIEVNGDCAYYRPVGKVTIEQGAGLVDHAIGFARAHQLSKLLINCAQLTGFPSPSLPQRYFLVRGWAKTAQGLVQVALVARPEMIDPEKFGVTVARNAGFLADVYPTEPEALAWLQRPPDGHAPVVPRLDQRKPHG
ncbi:MAG: hypothetical protein V9H26_23395 [Verrucomicrobiota bacterium]|nr:hypothetical protein [Verrucomicrobiota bacterium]